MQRKREQSGTTVRIGAFWCVRYADWRIEDGERIRKQGLTHKLTAVLEEHQRLKRPPKYVEKLQAEFMETVNATTQQAEQMMHEIGRHHPEMRKATLHKLRSILSGIFKRAIGQGCRPGHNPIREVTPPKGLPSGETYAYTLEEIRRMLGAMTDEVTRLII